jgi:cardiolipin synthase
MERGGGWRRATGQGRAVAAALVVLLLAAGCAAPSTATPATPQGSSRDASPAPTTRAPVTAPPATSAPPTAVTTTTGASAAVPPGGLALQVEPGAWPGAVASFISGAQHSVDMTMYELDDPATEDALAADAARGVRVRVLLDAEGEGRSENAAAATFLSAHGVAVTWGPSDTIVHQKTVVVDDRVAAVMTGNLTAGYYGDTRDFTVLDGEPADVAAIETVFGDDVSGQPIGPGPPGDDLVWSPGATGALLGVIDGATSTLLVENEEMDSTVVEQALEQAASRGVRVDVVMTEDSEWDAALGSLEAAGVHVALYPDQSGDLYIHAKTVVADLGRPDQRAYVGSQNFSTSSLEYNRELGIITSDPAVVGALGLVVLHDVLVAPGT